MPDDGKSVNRPWQEIAAEMTQEHDNERLLQLAKELNQAMEQEERKKVRKRVGLEENKPDAGAA